MYTDLCKTLNIEFPIFTDYSQGIVWIRPLIL